jgi:hypothetical protein
MSLQLALDFGAGVPEWAADCLYCVPDQLGLYDEKTHLANHQPIRCSLCGQTSPNRLLFDNSHHENLGWSLQHGWTACTALSLICNHLTYDLLHCIEPSPHELAIAVAVGVVFTPDGYPLAPEGRRLA